MSKIDELIEQLCPDGVEFKELFELGDFYGGLTGKSKNDFQDGNAKFVTYMNVFSNIAVDTNIDIFVKISENENQNKVEYGDVLFTGSSETPDECGMSSVLTKKIAEPLYLNSFCFGFRLHNKDLFLPDFLKYLFRDDSIRKLIGQTASGVTRFNVSKKRFAKVIIPIPPLPIQQEIVNILDKFTELQAELEAELEARKKQYEYYRNKLLTLEDGEVEWKMLGEVTKISNGKDHKLLPDGNFPVYGSGGIMRYANKYIYDQQSVLIPRKGSIGNIFYVDTPFWTVDTLFYTKIKCDIITPKYLYYYLKTQHLEDLNTAGGVPSLTKSVLDKVLIPIPPVAEQERIVAILDKFDALVNDISIGLPAEIEARRKQYEYYRGKLLDFKALASITDNGVEIGQL